MRRERFANDAESTLSASINDSVTTVTVDDASAFPTEGDFRIIIQNELLLVTAVSGNDLTVVRGIEGTAAAAHPESESVFHIITTSGLEKYVSENVHGNQDPTLPPLRLYDSSDNVLTMASFAWVNQAPATASDLGSGAILMDAISTAGNHMLTRPAPTPPYTIVAAFKPHLHHNNTCSVFLGFRESGTGKLALIAVAKANEHFVYDYSGPAAFNSALWSRTTYPYNHNLHWLKVEDDGANLLFSTSSTGLAWQQLVSVGRTSYMAGGPDQVMWGVNPNDATYSVHAALVHWSEQ